MNRVRAVFCRLTGGHDWTSGQMYSDGWTNTCIDCGATQEVDR